MKICLPFDFTETNLLIVCTMIMKHVCLECIEQRFPMAAFTFSGWFWGFVFPGLSEKTKKRLENSTRMFIETFFKGFLWCKSTIMTFEVLCSSEF